MAKIKKGELIQLRVTEHEKDAWIGRANEVDLSLTEYIRARINTFGGHTDEQETLLLMLRELRDIKTLFARWFSLSSIVD